jgi:hypothetical protein
VKKAYICLMGFPNEEAVAPGRSSSICVENWIVPTFTPGRGVTLPSNSASMIRGRDGLAVIEGVAEAGGVAVSTKSVGAGEGVICTAMVLATAVLTMGLGVGGMGTAAGEKRPAMNRAMAAKASRPESVKVRLARMRFCCRTR